jgi:hypothetical protein
VNSASRHLRLALAAWFFSVPCCAESPDGTLTDQSESEKRLLDRLMIAESGGKQFAKNPLSSALGPFQFVEGTFLDIMRRMKPALTRGRSDAEILRLRVDPEISRDAALIYIRETAKFFAAKNVAATPANLRLAFFVGQTGALKVLAASSDKPVSSFLSASTLAANPWLRVLTAGQLIRWSSRQVGGEEANPELRTIIAGQPAEQPSQAVGTVTTIAAISQDKLSSKGPPIAGETKAIAALPADLPLATVIAGGTSEKSSQEAEPAGSIIPFPEQPAAPDIPVLCNLKLASCRKWLALADKRSQLAHPAVRNQ